MKYKIFFLSLVCALNFYAQETDSTATTQQAVKQVVTPRVVTPVKKDNSLTGQFSSLVEQSNNWQTYKVVDYAKLNQYQRNVLDSLQSVKSKVTSQAQQIEKQFEEINTLNGNISQLQNELQDAKNQNDSVNFFGFLLSKSTYSILMWSLVVILAFFLFIYVYRFSNGNKVTQKALQDLNELQEEYENYRKSAIEREQKVRRQLQDEINKHR